METIIYGIILSQNVNFVTPLMKPLNKQERTTFHRGDSMIEFNDIYRMYFIKKEYKETRMNISSEVKDRIGYE